MLSGLIINKPKAEKSFISLLLICCLLNLSAYADDGSANWHFSGFGTIGATVTDEDLAEYRIEMTQFEGATSDIDFGLRSKLGAQVSVEMNQEWSVTGQILAKKRGKNNMDPGLEWLFVSYQPASWFDFRVGRLVLPVFMLSDYRPVSYSQPFVEPPGQVYIDASQSQFDGVQMINRIPIGNGSLSIQTSAGSAEAELLIVGFPVDLKVDDIANVNITYEWSDWLWRIGYQQSNIKPEINFIVPDFEDEFIGLGMQYDNGKLLVMGERIERNTKPQLGESASSYILAGWRFGKWLPSITKAQRNREATDPFNDSKSTALALRYDINNYMAVKVQWERVKPDLNTWLNASPGFLLGDDRDIYTLSLDFVY